MDSVKWLARITVLRPGEKPRSHDQFYTRLRKGQPPTRITTILVKSLINYPTNEAKLVAAVHPVSG